MEFIVKKSGSRTLLYQGHSYSKNKESKTTIRWRCTKRQSVNCLGALVCGTDVCTMCNTYAYVYIIKLKLKKYAVTCDTNPKFEHFII